MGAIKVGVACLLTCLILTELAYAQTRTSSRKEFLLLSNEVLQPISKTSSLSLGGSLSASSIFLTDGTQITGGSDVVSDATPQLGGNLDTNGKSILDVLGDVDIKDNVSMSGNLTTVGNIQSSKTFATNLYVTETIRHLGDVSDNTYFELTSEDRIRLIVGGLTFFDLRNTTQDYVAFGHGGDCDIQFKSNSDDNAIFVNGGTDRVGIGGNNPSAKLGVLGDASVSGNMTVSGSQVFITGLPSSNPNKAGQLYTTAGAIMVSTG